MKARESLKQAKDFKPEVLKLFDQYVHGLIDRRGFLAAAGRYATAGVTAMGLLEALSPQFAQAQQVAPDDARIQVRSVEIASPKGYGKARACQVSPAKAPGKLPVVIVVHENRGLNPHIEDIARRVALEGYIALAPDALFPLGGYPGDEDKARETFATLDQAKTREDFVAFAEYAQSLPEGSGKVGVTGFCYGGGIANLLAARAPDIIRAAAPFYGQGAPLDRVADIKAELLIHFAEHDERVNAGWPAYEAALKAARVRYTAHTYAGTQHGFNNDTTPRYDAEAAALAWQRTLELFARHLR